VKEEFRNPYSTVLGKVRYGCTFIASLFFPELYQIWAWLPNNNIEAISIAADWIENIVPAQGDWRD
jgi:hypothetical protein